jgi:hypothetical protein
MVRTRDLGSRTRRPWFALCVLATALLFSTLPPTAGAQVTNGPLRSLSSPDALAVAAASAKARRVNFTLAYDFLAIQSMIIEYTDEEEARLKSLIEDLPPGPRLRQARDAWLRAIKADVGVPVRAAEMSQVFFEESVSTQPFGSLYAGMGGATSQLEAYFGDIVQANSISSVAGDRERLAQSTLAVAAAASHREALLALVNSVINDCRSFMAKPLPLCSAELADALKAAADLVASGEARDGRPLLKPIFDRLLIPRASAPSKKLTTLGR